MQKVVWVCIGSSHKQVKGATYYGTIVVCLAFFAFCFLLSSTSVRCLRDVQCVICVVSLVVIYLVRHSLQNVTADLRFSSHQSVVVQTIPRYDTPDFPNTDALITAHPYCE